jgi:hypothetical protein
MSSKFFYFLLACLIAGCVVEINNLITGKHSKMIEQQELSLSRKNELLKDSLTNVNNKFVQLKYQNDSLRLELKACKIQYEQWDK